MPTRKRNTSRRTETGRAARLGRVAAVLAVVALTALGVLNWTRSPEGRAALLRFGAEGVREEVGADLDAVLAATLPAYAAAVADTADGMRRAVVEAPAGRDFWELQADLADALTASGARVMWGERLERPRRRGADPDLDPSLLRLDLGVADRPTHLLLLHPAGTPEPDVRWRADAARSSVTDLLGELDVPTVAIIVDDWGNGDTPETRSMLKLNVPLTLSVLPGLRYSRRYALAATELALPDVSSGVSGGDAEARRLRLARGCTEDLQVGRSRPRSVPRRRREVMLHLPMEPVSYPETNPGPVFVRVGMSRDEIASLVDGAMANLPGVTGVNNHMGSAATADRATMDRLADVLRERDLLFVDSMTTARSVAAAAHREAGVPTLVNRLFLDQAETSEEQVSRLLKRLVDAARRSGSAVALCHPYPETVAVLRRELPRYVKDGIRFVTVSEMVALERAKDARDAALTAAAPAEPEVRGAAP